MFKELNNSLFGFINFNNEAKKYVVEIIKGDLLNSDFCNEILEFVENKFSVDFTYGGWMEDRSFLWSGSYLEKTGNFIHLGVDFNVPAGTKIFSEYEIEVVHMENDYPLNHGWGQMLIGYVQEKNICILYGHLSNKIYWKVGDQIKKDMVIGKVGEVQENGFWFPHLHVQTITKDYFDYVKSNNLWKEFDGYGNRKDIEKLAKIYKDPLNYVSLF